MAVSKSKKEISIRQFAKTIGTSHTAIIKAIGDGKFVKGYDAKTKKINPAVALKDTWVIEQLDIKPKRGVSLKKAIEKVDNSKSAKQKKAEEIDDDLLTDESIEELIASLKVNGKMNPHTAFKYQQIVNLAQSRLKLMQDAGMLVDKAKVNNALFKIGNEIKKELMNIPKRIARDVMAAPNEVEAINIMNDEFAQLLTLFANLKIATA